MSKEAPLFFLIAGEPSGDALGASLMRALKARLDGKLRFAGIGGQQMAAEGLTSLVPIRELAIMGIAEVLPSAFRILRRVRETIAAIEALCPVVVVTIDSSGFCFRVGEKLKPRPNRPLLVHYVAPMVWAWRAHRARNAARACDHLLTLLPFEPPYFAEAGLPATYVGHPVVESGADRGDGPAFRTRHGIDPDIPVLCVLPGSRRSEVGRLLPVFAAAIRRLAARWPGLVIILPTVETVGDLVRAQTADWPVRVIVVEGAREKFDGFAAARAALAASGTVSLELAMARLPMVIAYRLFPPTAWLLRRILKVRHVTLINILEGSPVVPELLQEHCTAEGLEATLTVLMTDDTARRQQIAGMEAALRRIGLGDKSLPSGKAADRILMLLRDRGLSVG